MNPTLLRGLAILWTTGIAAYKAYKAGTLDPIAMLDSIDWAALSAAAVVAWAFLKRAGDVTAKQHEDAIQKAADSAYDQGREDAIRESMAPRN